MRLFLRPWLHSRFSASVFLNCRPAATTPFLLFNPPTQPPSLAYASDGGHFPKRKWVTSVAGLRGGFTRRRRPYIFSSSRALSLHVLVLLSRVSFVLFVLFYYLFSLSVVLRLFKCQISIGMNLLRHYFCAIWTLSRHYFNIISALFQH